MKMDGKTITLKKLKRVREAHEVSQAALAKKAGVTIHTVTTAESGTKVEAGVLLKLSKALGVKPSTIRA